MRAQTRKLLSSRCAQSRKQSAKEAKCFWTNGETFASATTFRQHYLARFPHWSLLIMHTLLCFKKTIAITIDVLWECGALFFILRGALSGDSFSNVPITFQARNAICETDNLLFWEADLLPCLTKRKMTVKFEDLNPFCS